MFYAAWGTGFLAIQVASSVMNFGFGALLRRRQTLPRLWIGVLANIGRRLGLTITAVRLSNPVAGIDVDKVADHELAEAIIAGRA